MKVNMQKKELKAVREMVGYLRDGFGCCALDDILGKDREEQVAWLRKFGRKIDKLLGI